MSQARKASDIAASINGAIGKNVMRIASDPEFVTEVLPTGVLPIDILLQGGFARGRMTGISGTYSSLKTLIALRSMGATQSGGGMAGFIDAEKTYDPEWATQAGVNTSELLYVRPGTGEEAFDALEAMVRSGVDLVVVDSVAALLPQDERDKAMADERTQPGRLAALMSRGLRKITAANSRTAIVWLNQTRMQVGITFGNPEKPTGGLALPFYLSQHVVMSKTGKVTEPTQVWDGEKWTASKLQLAQKFSAQLEKSKLNMPQRSVHFVWDFRSAEIDLPGFLIGQGLEHGIVIKRGNTWEYGGVKAVGREKFQAALAQSTEDLKALDLAIRQAHWMPLSSYRGGLATPKSGDAPTSRSKRAASAPDSTPGPDPAASRSTRRARTPSSSSRTSPASSA